MPLKICQTLVHFFHLFIQSLRASQKRDCDKVAEKTWVAKSCRRCRHRPDLASGVADLGSIL
jgi:hypothetical protein